MALTSTITSQAANRGSAFHARAREGAAFDLANLAVRNDAYVNCLRDTTRIWGDTKGNQPYSRP